MSWFNKNKKKKRAVLHSFSVPALIRQSIYDTMLSPPEAIAKAMGLPPVSDEVSEMEERASDERISRVAVLLPFIDSHSDITSHIISSAYFLESEDSGEIELEELQEMTKLFKLVSRSATVAALSTLVDLNLIEIKVTDDDE